MDRLNSNYTVVVMTRVAFVFPTKGPGVEVLFIRLRSGDKEVVALVAEQSA